MIAAQVRAASLWAGSLSQSLTLRRARNSQVNDLSTTQWRGNTMNPRAPGGRVTTLIVMFGNVLAHCISAPA
nr:hypothetical protein [Saccharothrix syringae]